MTEPLRVAPSACPHDCPSTCALEIEILPDNRIGRVRGAADNDYTLGVICAKVARYAERQHHPDRLIQPLKRTGPRGSGQYEAIGWDEALDLTADAMLAAEARHGAEAVWPYYYAGTMGLVMRDGLQRLRYAKGYSGQVETICSSISGAAWHAGHGKRWGTDPREMADADVIVIWGTNPVNTQVNVMTHATRARKARGAKIIAIDIYENGTVKQADKGIILKPGTDAAFACAVMHVLFRDGHADRAYLARFADRPDDFERHLADKTPAWAEAITGVPADEIEAFARLVGTTPRTFFRLGYGFTRSRNGAVSMHAASCIPVVTGAWQHRGGGCFHNNGAVYGLDTTLIEGRDVYDRNVRTIDMCLIGRALNGDADALKGGPPIDVIFMQNVNPAVVAPEQALVKQGLMRDDLFICVHEQFMTETARFADVVLPATMFTEHDDIYVGGGHPYLMFGGKLVEAPGTCRSNHDVLCGLAERVGAEHEGFRMTPREIIDRTLQVSGHGTLAELEERRWIDCQPPFEEAHFLNGFGHADGKFRFAPDWSAMGNSVRPNVAGVEALPTFPDHWAVIEAADETHPFRLATSPARNYLNSSFTETPTSRSREGAPTVKAHSADLAAAGLADGDAVEIGNARGVVRLTAESFDGVRRGVLVVESIPPNAAFAGGVGINTLIGAAPVAPVGGGAFHDCHVWLRPAA